MRVENDILIPELARLLAEGKEVRFTPSGVSMRPFIEGDKDSVVLSPLDSSPKKGDLLLAEATALDGQKKYVLHRLIDIEGAETSEPLYIRAGIIGRVTRIETPSGRTKPLTRGRLWLRLKPHRSFLLKLYRHTILKWLYS